MFLWQLAAAGPESKRKEIVALGACEVAAKVALAGDATAVEAPQDNTALIGVLSALASADDIAEPKVYSEELCSLFYRTLQARSAAAESAALSWLVTMSEQTRAEVVAENVYKAAEADNHTGLARVARVIAGEKSATDRSRLDATRLLTSLLAAAAREGCDARLAAVEAACRAHAVESLLQTLQALQSTATEGEDVSDAPPGPATTLPAMLREQSLVCLERAMASEEGKVRLLRAGGVRAVVRAVADRSLSLPGRAAGAACLFLLVSPTTLEAREYIEVLRSERRQDTTATTLGMQELTLSRGSAGIGEGGPVTPSTVDAAGPAESDVGAGAVVGALGSSELTRERGPLGVHEVPLGGATNFYDCPHLGTDGTDRTKMSKAEQRMATVAEQGGVEALTRLLSYGREPEGEPGGEPGGESGAESGGEPGGEQGAAPVEEKSKKKKSKKKKGKKGKALAPGQAESQAFCAAALRQLSQDASYRSVIAEVGGIRALHPLLEAQSETTRFYAREAMLNIGMDDESLAPMESAGVPKYLQNIATFRMGVLGRRDGHPMATVH